MRHDCDELDAKLASAETYIAKLEAERAEMVELLREIVDTSVEAAPVSMGTHALDLAFDFLTRIGAEAKG